MRELSIKQTGRHLDNGHHISVRYISDLFVEIRVIHWLTEKVFGKLSVEIYNQLCSSRNLQTVWENNQGPFGCMTTMYNKRGPLARPIGYVYAI